ncbi:MAG: hypothetical protein C0485_13295 [Pirellula sp.]|nr:hypothetical protein [Pirellula sp.]
MVLRSKRMLTFTESVEALKQQYTDKYVVVDPGRPELARFEHYVGQVKTVNMSGRALVEFLDYHLNIGWFDIDLTALTVVDKPTEESKAKAEAKRAVAPAAPAAAKPAAAAAGGKKLSPLEMARQQGAQKAAGAAAPAKPASGGGKQSVADILSAARAGAKPAAAATPAEPKAEKPKPAPAAPKPAAADGKIRPVDKSTMTIDQMIAYCREHDANRAG